MAAKRPNVLFLFSDQHARHVAGCYGDRVARTPAVDRLASRLADEPSMKPSAALSWVCSAAEGAWRERREQPIAREPSDGFPDLDAAMARLGAGA